MTATKRRRAEIRYDYVGGRRRYRTGKYGVRGLARDQTELNWFTPAGRRRRKTNRRRKITIIERLFRWIKVPTGKVRRKPGRR